MLDPTEPALLALKVGSIGRCGMLTQQGITPSLESHIAGNVGSFVPDPVLGNSRLVGGVKVNVSVEDATIVIMGDVSHFKVGRNLDRSTVTIRGESLPDPSIGTQTVGIFQVRGNLDASQLLVGYDESGAPANRDVQIGRVKVGGDRWTSRVDRCTYAHRRADAGRTIVADALPRRIRARF